MLHIIIATKLKEENFDAFMVGGVVRDMLLGIDPNDIDLVTNATPDQIKKLFEKEYKIYTVGKSFLVTIISNGTESVDVATYRTEKSTGPGHKDFEISYTDDLWMDVFRRDFTFNAMPMCPITCDLLDVVGGKKDLMLGIVRFVGSAEDRIDQDPERMLRAARFAALLKGNLDDKAWKAIKKKKDLIDIIPKERIYIEIMKAMKCQEASRFFYILQLTGILEKIFPALSSCYEHPHGKYHFEDVFEHQMLVGDYISTKCPLVKLTGYLHDCGKPMAYQIHGDGSFIDHHIYGEEILRKELMDLRFPLKEIDFIANLTRCHMTLRSKEYSKKTIRKALVKFNDRGLHYTHFLRLGLADKAGSLKRNFTKTEAKQLIRDIEACVFEEESPVFGLKDLAINGNDIMKTLKIPPSKAVGDKLKELLEMVLENPELNNRELLLKELVK